MAQKDDKLVREMMEFERQFRAGRNPQQEILDEAKATDAMLTESQEGQDRVAREIERNKGVELRPVGPMRARWEQVKDYFRPLEPAKKIAEAAALPALFAGGPAAAAAGGYYALDALKQAAESPSMGTAANLGLAAIPGIGPARRFGRAALELDEAAQMANRFRGVKGLTGPRPAARAVVSDISHNEIPMVRGRLEDAMFRQQTPEVLDAAETVAAPGFELGPITPIGQVPTSKAKMAADAMRAMQGQTAPKMAAKLRPNEGQVAGFTDLTPEEIAAAEELGYTYGQGIPETVPRRR